MDILSEIIKVEEEIQERLREEKKKAGEWLDRLRTEVEEEVKKEKERLNKLHKDMLEDEVKRSEKEAEGIVRRAHEISEGLRGISEERLRGIVKRHIMGILPAAGHKSAPGKGTQKR